MDSKSLKQHTPIQETNIQGKHNHPFHHTNIHEFKDPSKYYDHESRHLNPGVIVEQNETDGSNHGADKNEVKHLLTKEQRIEGKHQQKENSSTYNTIISHTVIAKHNSKYRHLGVWVPCNGIICDYTALYRHFEPRMTPVNTGLSSKVIRNYKLKIKSPWFKSSFMDICGVLKEMGFSKDDVNSGLELCKVGTLPNVTQAQLQKIYLNDLQHLKRYLKQNETQTHKEMLAIIHRNEHKLYRDDRQHSNNQDDMTFCYHEKEVLPTQPAASRNDSSFIDREYNLRMWLACSPPFVTTVGDKRIGEAVIANKPSDYVVGERLQGDALSKKSHLPKRRCKKATHTRKSAWTGPNNCIKLNKNYSSDHRYLTCKHRNSPIVQAKMEKRRSELLTYFMETYHYTEDDIEPFKHWAERMLASEQELLKITELLATELASNAACRQTLDKEKHIKNPENDS